jgi:tetratricopeptide (TPR) repeat protein
MPETDTTELIREARALSADHDLEPALEKFRSAQRAGDDAPDVHFDIGSVLTDLERYREARVEYGDAVAPLTRAMQTAEDYEMARLFNDRGVAKALSGDLQASLADWDEAIALAVGWYPMASKSRGRVLLALRDYSGADRAYRTAIGGPWCSPGTSPCPCNGRRSGGGAQRGADSYRARPGRASPYLILARALRAVSGDDAEADAALATVITICEKDIVQRRDRPVALYLQAYAQLELRRYGEAVASFDEAIGLLRRGGAESSRLFAAYSGYGRALTCAERFGEALGACQRALELAPQSGEQRGNALANLAYVLGRLGDVDQAISRIEEARAAASARERQSGPFGKDRPPAGNRGWGLLGTEAMIRVAAAEKYGDAESWSAAVGAFQEAAKAAGHLRCAQGGPPPASHRRGRPAVRRRPAQPGRHHPARPAHSCHPGQHRHLHRRRPRAHRRGRHSLTAPA